MIANPNNALKRIRREIDDLNKNPITGITITPDSEDQYHMTAILNGPKGTPYQLGQFKLDITFTSEYPFKPPYVVFKTQVFHPNVNGESICLDILNSSWSPALKIQQVLLSISSFLVDPCAENGYGNEATELLLANDQEGFDNQCRSWVEKYAMDKPNEAEEEEVEQPQEQIILAIEEIILPNSEEPPNFQQSETTEPMIQLQG